MVPPSLSAIYCLSRRQNMASAGSLDWVFPDRFSQASQTIAQSRFYPNCGHSSRFGGLEGITRASKSISRRNPVREEGPIGNSQVTSTRRSNLNTAITRGSNVCAGMDHHPDKPEHGVPTVRGHGGADLGWLPCVINGRVGRGWIFGLGRYC